MKPGWKIVGLLSQVVVPTCAVLLQGAKGGWAAKDTKTPLRVTFHARDDSGNPCAMRGHSATGDECVSYLDTAGHGDIDAYMTSDGALWFTLFRCHQNRHVDLDFRRSGLPDPGRRDSTGVGADGVFAYAEGDMTDFRMTTVGIDTTNFMTMSAGTYFHKLGVHFWTPVDDHGWKLLYDHGDHHASLVQTRCEVLTSGNLAKRKWTVTPVLPRGEHLGYAGARLEKCHNGKSVKDDRGCYDYGTWRMPFKIVLEQQ